ncbi:MAG: insulinase family protein [bacterium]|nr:insulinase family protein [bacterium]
MRTTLDNGLKVVLIEDHSAPVVALNVWVRVGSADEQASEAGMAHVFEHMLFKGTERRAVGEIASTVEAAGGNINAFTSFDMTVYHITMASRDSAVGIDVLADAVQHSTFDPEELTREELVVLEEINRSEDSPRRAHSRATFETTFTQHPYSLPVIGTAESVKSFTRDGLLDFFHKWYVPNNMAFVAVGDLDPDKVMEQIKSAFADAQPRAGLEHPRPPEPVQDSSRSKIVRSEFEQTLLGISYPATSFRDPETPFLDLLSMVLGGGDSSRLYRNVKDREGLVHGISAGAYTPLDPGLFMVDAVLEGDKIEPTLEAVAEEIERLRAFGPGEKELERARVNLLSGEVHEKETMQGQARKYGYFETLAGGIELEEEYLRAVRNATPEDLKRVAQKYLRADRASIVVLLAKDVRPDLTDNALFAALDVGLSAERSVTGGEQLAGGIHTFTLPNGLRVVVKPNTTIPLVSMRLSFLGGLLAESEETQGISSFLSDVLERGTEQRSAAQLAAEIEGIAGSIEGFSGRNSFGLTGEFLKESLDEGLDLFSDVLLHPAFDPEEIEKARVERLAALRRSEDNLSSKAFEIFQREIYPGHPYRFRAIGTEESLGKINRKALANYYETYARPSNGVLSVVGDVDPDAVVESLSQYLSDWTGDSVVSLPEREIPSPASEARETSLTKNKNQVHIVMGFQGLKLGDPDVPALEVLTQVLSGQGGRLFLELRDKQSLAYSVTAFAIEGLDPGIFGVYIASAPDKLDQSLAGLRSELDKLLNGPIEEEEIARARAYLIGSQAVSLQRYSSQASLLSLDTLYTLGADRHLDYAKHIDAVTLDDLKRVAKRLIQLDKPVIAIVR